MKRIILVLVPVFMISFFTLQAQINNPWVVPDDYKEMINPVKPEKESTKAGKKLYKAHCMSCHGEYGHGDGLAAVEFNIDPSDLTFDDIDVQKDGELFYKIKIGNDQMHTYSDKLSDEDIWNVVNYARTLYPKK